MWSVPLQYLRRGKLFPTTCWTFKNNFHHSNQIFRLGILFIFFEFHNFGVKKKRRWSVIEPAKVRNLILKCVKFNQGNSAIFSIQFVSNLIIYLIKKVCYNLWKFAINFHCFRQLLIDFSSDGWIKKLMSPQINGICSFDFSQFSGSFWSLFSPFVKTSVLM